MSEAFYCQTQDLAIGYGKTPLLQNIGIGVQRGQILALIGPNGAGKSTLLKTLAGQLAAQSGAVLLQGQNLTTYTPNARARKMALMLPHTRHTELTTCFDVAAAGRCRKSVLGGFRGVFERKMPPCQPSRSERYPPGDGCSFL